jgi:hypothetical protein
MDQNVNAGYYKITKHHNQLKISAYLAMMAREEKKDIRQCFSNCESWQ